LADIPDLLQELNLFKKEPFRTLSVTDRVLSVNQKNFNLSNGHSWKSEVKKLDDNWTVISTENSSYSHQQQSIVERFVQGHKEHAFMLKVLPESRMEIIVGFKCKRDIEFICYITNQLYLIKFIETSNWVIIDREGHSRELPVKLRSLLGEFGCAGPENLTQKQL